MSVLCAFGWLMLGGTIGLFAAVICVAASRRDEVER